MIITVSKIGDGTDENPYRPKTDTTQWQIIEERENEFIIETLDD